MKVQSTILDLERRVGALTGFPTIPGTSISRVQVDREIALRDGIKVPDGKEAVFVWCLALGAASMPKSFVRGSTIISTLKKAQKLVASWERMYSPVPARTPSRPTRPG